MARTADMTFCASASLLLLLSFTRSADVSADRANSTNRPHDVYGDDEHDRGNGTGNRPNGFADTWAANMFYDVLWNFTVSKGVGSSACQEQTQMYIRHLENGSLWAVKMSDSWSRYPNGMLVGTTHQMGVYDECVEVHRPVRGKYCVPQIVLGTANDGNGDRAGGPEQLQSGGDRAWREILEFVDDDRHVRRNHVKFGICIPDSCTASDLEISLQKEFDKRFLPRRVRARVTVDSMLCSTGKDMFPYDAGYYLTCVLIGSILSICCLSTAYHLTIIVRSGNGEKTHKMSEVFGSFSIIRNVRDLIKYDKHNSLNVFNGVKVFVMVLVLFGHKFLYAVSNPLVYGKLVERIYEIGPDILLTCMNLVDPFFYVTGFLMYHMLIDRFEKSATSWYHVPAIIVYKYLRILPAYAIMILLTAFVIPHLDDGPFWASRMWPEADRCRNYWWANLLAVSNFVQVENQCLIASWYISCLMQFLAIGTVVVYVCAKNRKIGTCSIAALLCASLVVPFVMTHVHRVYAIVRVVISFFESPRNSEEFRNFYRPFYLRGTPYFAGLLAGVVVEQLKKRETKFSPLVVYVGTAAVAVACVFAQLYGASFYDLTRPYSVLEQSFYATFNHCIWATLLFWVTVCHFTSGYGPIEKLFNNRLMTPLGRLSYTVYIVNITVMLMIESRQRIAVYPSVDVFIDGWMFGMFRTYLVSTLLYITVDAPFGLLIKRIFYGKKRNSNASTIKNTTNAETADEKISTHL